MGNPLREVDYLNFNIGARAAALTLLAKMVRNLDR
jgi:hypothetical protein